MNTNYTPHPWHYIYPLIAFALGTLFLLKPDWEPLGVVCWLIGIVSGVIISLALGWDVFIRKAQAIQYLFDSAKGLDRERTNDLLIAMGLKPMPPQKSNVTINRADHTGAIQQTHHIYNMPASLEQLKQIAHGILIEHAPFSRREWVDRRAVFSDGAWREFQTTFEKEKLIALRNPANPNHGFMVTQEGDAFLREYLPSPTPQMETA